LLTVAPDAYERATEMLWEHETPVSYEMGSNTAAWGDNAVVVRDPMPPNTWFTLILGWGLPDHQPRAYDHLLVLVTAALADDPAWATWWSATGVPECVLSLLLDSSGHTAPGVTVRKGRTRIAADVVRIPPPFAGDDPAELLPRAVDEVLSILQLLRERFDLPALPPLTLPPVDPDIPRGYHEPEPVPVLPPGLFKRLTRKGGITPETVASYYRDNPDAEGAQFWLPLVTPDDPSQRPPLVLQPGVATWAGVGR
jgi:hypothetical protein